MNYRKLKEKEQQVLSDIDSNLNSMTSDELIEACRSLNNLEIQLAAEKNIEKGLWAITNQYMSIRDIPELALASRFGM